MTDLAELARRTDVIERGYEYLLAFAAQGRRDDSGSEVRETLTGMQAALDGLAALIPDAFASVVADDARKAGAAIALVLGRAAIGSLLVDNLNASIHLRALLTDLFLIDQAFRAR